jgi:hypothetical protein
VSQRWWDPLSISQSHMSSTVQIPLCKIHVSLKFRHGIFWGNLQMNLENHQCVLKIPFLFVIYISFL